MKNFRSYQFHQEGDGCVMPYTLNMYVNRNIFAIFGNADLLGPYEEMLCEEILNDGLAQSLEQMFEDHPKMLTQKATFIRGMNFMITGIKGQEMADKFFDTAVKHFSKYLNAYSLTRMHIVWEKAPEWAKFWVALPQFKAVFSDQKPVLNKEQTAWVFPNNSIQVEADNMNYVGDWRKLIAERGGKYSSIVISKNFKASQYRDQYCREISYEEAMNENLILCPENKLLGNSASDLQLIT